MEVKGMRVVRLRFALLAGAAFALVLCFHVLVWSRPPTFEEVRRSDEARELACRHPRLQHDNPLILKHIVDLGPLECKRELDWVEIQPQGLVAVHPVIAKRHGRVKCRITYLVRTDDFSNAKGKVDELDSDTGPLPLRSDFFHAECEAGTDGLRWKGLLAGVARREAAAKRARASPPPPDSMGLNVLMFGLDSMSRMHYMRKLPKTYRYIQEVLGGSVLEGYNIVGDGTPQALIPILTGYAEPELPETRKRMDDANYVNVYPFAWKNFSANGYVTAYGEDLPTTGVFTYRLKGFDEPPTDHYMRPFYVEMDKVLKEHPRLCLGNKPRHLVMLEWLRSFYAAYPDVPKFALGFHGELSHDDYNTVGYADEDLVAFLHGLRDADILSNTLVIFFSDHGHRFSSIREMQQGKQEERLPFFAVLPPPWFSARYPTHARNLRTNERRLATPFDIHATLMTLLRPNVPLRGDLGKRDISLFSEISQERTCTMAHIELHWCACLSWAPLAADDPSAAPVALAVVDLVNSLTEAQRALCSPLRLAQVTRLQKLQPNNALLKFRKNSDRDGFVGEFSDDTRLTELVFEVQLRTEPGGALYEASVAHSALSGEYVVREDELSRVNMYGNQEHCIHDAFPNLRKYCYCKEQL